MRTTLSIDDELLARAQSLCGQLKTSELVTLALKALIARESAKRLRLLGGSEPELSDTPRRRQREP